MTIYAVADIHGYSDKLIGALDRIERDGGPDARIVFLGDYVDRGPDSQGVIQILSQGIKRGRNWVTLKGNHDRLYSYYLRDTPQIDPQILIGMDWFHDRIGGKETLASYGVTITDKSRHFQIQKAARAAIPLQHITFMEGLPAYHLEDNILFVHAGIKPHVALDQQSEDDLIWIRKPFHDHKAPHPWLIVHGHTPVRQAKHYGNRVNLDAGAGYGFDLTVACFEDAKAFTLTDSGRIPLLPDT